MGKPKITPAKALGKRAEQRVKDAGEPGKGEKKDPGLDAHAAGVGDAVTALTEALDERND